MIFSGTVIGKHPASSGYIVECFVKGNEDASLQMSSGSGSLKIEFPEYSVTGLEFEGKNLLFEPTGADLQIMEQIRGVSEQINLTAFFEGDTNGPVGEDSVQNIRNIDVYTGDEPNFNVDSLFKSNRITDGNYPMSLISGESSYVIKVTSSQIADRVEENLFYKIIPSDYLTFGDVSPAASGIMFSGFPDLPTIPAGTSEFVISRTNANDLLGSQAQTTDIFAGVTMLVDNTMPLNWKAGYTVKTNSDITISGISGAVISSSNASFPVVNNAILISGVTIGSTFTISTLLDSNGVKGTPGYIIS